MECSFAMVYWLYLQFMLALKHQIVCISCINDLYNIHDYNGRINLLPNSKSFSGVHVPRYG